MILRNFSMSLRIIWYRGAVLVETVSVDNDFHAYLTSLVAGQLVVKLHVVEGQVMDLLFSFSAEYGAYGNEQSQHYIVHNVMALNKHIGIVWMDSQTVEFFFHAFNFFQRFRMMAFPGHAVCG